MKIGELVRVINHVNSKGEIVYRTCTGTIGLVVEIRPITTKTQIVIDVQTLVDKDGNSTDYTTKPKDERYLELTITDVAPVTGGSVLTIEKGMCIKVLNNKSLYIVTEVNDMVLDVINYVTGAKQKMSVYAVNSIIPTPKLGDDWYVRASKTNTGKFLCSHKKYTSLKRKYIDSDNFAAHHHELFDWFKKAKAKLVSDKPGAFVKGTTTKVYKFGKSTMSKEMTNIHEKSGWFQELMATKYVDLMLSKYSQKFEPDNNIDHFIGAEVECYTKLSHEKLAVQLAKHGLHKFCRITSDGSIRAERGYQGAEIRVLAKESEYKTVIKTLFDALKDPAIDAEVNNSCGLHVHFDMRNRKVERTYENLMCMLRLARNAVPEHRRNNQYCVTPKSPFYSEQLSYAQHYDSISLTAYKKQKTIEIRLLEGTLDTTVLSNWIKLWIDLINIDEIDRNYSSIERFKKDFPDFDTSFLEERILKFK